MVAQCVPHLIDSPLKKDSHRCPQKYVLVPQNPLFAAIQSKEIVVE